MRRSLRTILHHHRHGFFNPTAVSVRNCHLPADALKTTDDKMPKAPLEIDSKDQDATTTALYDELRLSNWNKSMHIISQLSGQPDAESEPKSYTGVEVWTKMEQLDIPVPEEAFESILLSCYTRDQNEKVKAIGLKIFHQGFEHNFAYYVAALRTSPLKDATSIFEEYTFDLPKTEWHVDVVNAFLATQNARGKWTASLDISIDMLENQRTLGSKYPSLALISLVQQGKPQVALQYYRRLAKYDTLNLYLKAYDIMFASPDIATDVFQAYTAERPATEWNVGILHSFLLSREREKDFALIVDTCLHLESNLHRSFISIFIQALVQEKKFDLALKYYHEAKGQKIPLRQSVHTMLMEADEQIAEVLQRDLLTLPASEWDPSLAQAQIELCAKSSEWNILLGICNQLIQHAVPLKGYTLQFYIDASLHEGGCALLLKNLETMKQHGVSPDPFLYKHIFSCDSLDDPVAAFEHYSAQLPPSDWDKGVVHQYLRHCAYKKNWTAVINTCNELVNDHMPLNHGYASFLIRGLVATRESELALWYYNEIKESGFSLQAGAYQALIFACRGELQSEAPMIFTEYTKRLPVSKWGLGVIQAFLKNRASAGDWKTVLEICTQLVENQVAFDQRYASFLIRALVHHGDYQTAEKYFQQMQDRSIKLTPQVYEVMEICSLANESNLE